MRLGYLSEGFGWFLGEMAVVWSRWWSPSSLVLLLLDAWRCRWLLTDRSRRRRRPRSSGLPFTLCSSPPSTLLWVISSNDVEVELACSCWCLPATWALALGLLSLWVVGVVVMLAYACSWMAGVGWLGFGKGQWW